MIVFADDTDLVTDGNQVKNIMNRMLGTYDGLCAITRGCIEFNKSKYYTWQWKWS